MRVDREIASFDFQRDAIAYAKTLALCSGETFSLIGSDTDTFHNPRPTSSPTSDGSWALVGHLGNDEGDEKVVAKFSTEEAALDYALSSTEHSTGKYRKDSLLNGYFGCHVERWVDNVPVDPKPPVKKKGKTR